jgi:hypothetical protein
LVAISVDSKHFLFCFPEKNPKNNPQGAGGSPNFVLPKILFSFCDLKPHTKFQNPTITPSERNANVGGKEEQEQEKKKTPSIVDT